MYFIIFKASLTGNLLSVSTILILSSPTASDDEFENLRIKGPNAVQLVKTTPLKLSPLPTIPDTIKEVIYDMLNALAAYHAPEERKMTTLRGFFFFAVLKYSIEPKFCFGV